MPGTVVAVDLDRTLIYSRAAIDAMLAPPDVPPLTCVELLDGRPQSFLTNESAHWLELLGSRSVLVPTTTRTVAQYGRVQLPGRPAAYAVTSNGGHIIVDGRSDEPWRSAVGRRIAGDGAALAEIVDGLHGRVDPSWVLNSRVADDLFCYLVVDVARLPGDFLAGLTSWCADRNWVVSMQGRKIYALPRALTKEAAITEVRSRVGGGRLIAAGDGALDAGFLAMADAAIRPAHGELAEIGWGHPHVSVTGRAGVLAGEEISRWLVEQLGPADHRPA
jgi:hypothetical protein